MAAPEPENRPPRSSPSAAAGALVRLVQGLLRRLAHALRGAVPRSRTPRRTPGTFRASRGLPAAPPGPDARGARTRRWGSAAGLVVITVLGAWLGLLVVGNVRTPVGPMDTTMTLRPSFSGGTKINVSPLGALELESHHAPVRLDVDIDQLDPVRANALVDHPERLSGLEDEIVRDVRAGAVEVAGRSVVAVVVGATALGLAVYRRPRRAATAGGLALLLLLTSGATAYATWNPKSVLEPKFSGLLAGAPSVVGNARSIVTEFNVYQQELARLVTNVTKLYEATSTLPAYAPDPTTTRVLHVADIHLNPAAWSIIRSLVEQYDIDVIVDAGDTMDHGTTAENGFLEPIPDLGAPYVWVRGNHDSIDTQQAVADLGENVHVLDNGVPVDVAGLRFAGMGDPQFTPDRSVVPEGDPAERAAGRELAFHLRAQKRAGTPVDIAVAHNPVLAQQTDGLVPLALAGHTHQRSNEVLDDGTRLMVEGTTGGGGLRAVEGDEPQKVQASVLYLDEKTDRLQAWDEITLGGLGLAKAEVSRHLPGDLEPGASPSPTPTAPTPETPGTPAAPPEGGTRSPSPSPTPAPGAS
ncbi:metallophosphoesterase [Streptomyces sp. JJ36]|uniref:metallophosphoesterase family protein n=1 Tax=Streptomyces sp. JJ36 TaxID=2736645 RepID=UPI001F31EB2C|nr:metallophosphoesterase [Streptomyces sp. JJ36]MCF6523626.1 metallophosphoesterase [Streptomyces sp. JJ36]